MFPPAGEMLLTKHMKQQESIPVGCVPATFVVWGGYDVTSCLVPGESGPGWFEQVQGAGSAFYL